MAGRTMVIQDKEAEMMVGSGTPEDEWLEDTQAYRVRNKHLESLGLAQLREQKILDAGCGPGKTTSILSEMVSPGGQTVGIDYSKERIQYARMHYSKDSEIDFYIHDLREPLDDFGTFDFIWVRFVLEYNLKESPQIVKNLTKCLRAGGYLCLLDLDYNCLSHYGLSGLMESMLFKLIK